MCIQSIVTNCLKLSGLLVMSVWASPNWFTLNTAHFNVHYTQGHEAWARSAAQELEIVRDKVWQQQKRVLEGKADVVVFDPNHAANGFALPSTDNPLMALFTTPPQSDTAISNHASWQQLLILHEYIHLVHLSQPSRHHWKQVLRDSWDIFDLSQAMMPRWVAEGYATLMESKMTGRGRIYDNYTNALLTELAQQGGLLSYDQLNEGNDEYYSKAMAYLLGGRFLAWLEAHYSQSTLDAVWTRMRAVESRSFDSAFYGVFAEHPATLYRRFIAEFTYKAMAKEQQEAPLHSTLWQDYKYSATSPALSADGSKLAIVERDRKGRVKLNVYETKDDPTAEEEFIEQQQARLVADPKDIADVRPKVFAKKTLHTLEPINFSGIRYPKWYDENSLYFIASVYGQNTIHARRGELFKWSLDTGKVEQLTQELAIRRFTLSQDGQTIFAEQVLNGYSELVQIDTNKQEVTPLFSKQLSTLYDFPTLHDAQQQLAYLKHTLNQGWKLYIQDLATQEQRQVPMPQGYQYATQPSWSKSGDALYFVAGNRGSVDIYRYELATNALYKLTQGQSLFAFPMEQPSGELLYLSSGFQGNDMHQLPAIMPGQLVYELAEQDSMESHSIRAKSRQVQSASAQLEPQIQLPLAKIYQHEAKVAQYDIWQQSASMALGTQYTSASTSVLNVGVKGSDFLEQLSWHVGLTQGVTNNALNGMFAKARYQHGQSQWDLHIFDYKLDAQKQYESTLGYKEQHGVYGQFSRAYQWQQLRLQGQLSGLASKQHQQGHNVSENWLRVGAQQSWQYDNQSYAIGQKLSGYWVEGKTDGQDWQGQNITGTLFGKAFYMPMYVSYQFAKRQRQTLQLGGFSSSLLPQSRLVNMQIAPDLPFYAAQGNKYEGYGGAIALRASSPWLYYQQHQLDEQVFAQSYGVKWSTGLNGQTWLGKFAPAGLSDLRLDVGLSRVEGDKIDNENRAWLGLWYDL
ncbi:Tol-Pal system protein TolB [Pseudoalteromonas holothuriae]|uniref:Tol-Pal system protein TolB n=1 Tax=Pseudoalteromonas holothuriae TaxID=2963714 RepID=A0ABM9GM04_9GAMM|nr:Tol-Pal system protein TolB [Pseudoalteromonas sp. CIP111951]